MSALRRQQLLSASCWIPNHTSAAAVDRSSWRKRHWEGGRTRGFTFVDMLGRGALRAEKGEPEEREEPQSSPLGHHFSQMNLCRLQEPGGSFTFNTTKNYKIKKWIRKYPSPGVTSCWGNAQQGDDTSTKKKKKKKKKCIKNKSSKCYNAQKHPEAGSSSKCPDGTWSRREEAAGRGRAHCFLNLCRGERSERKQWNQSMATEAQRKDENNHRWERRAADSTPRDMRQIPPCVKHKGQRRRLWGEKRELSPGGLRKKKKIRSEQKEKSPPRPAHCSRTGRKREACWRAGSPQAPRKTGCGAREVWIVAAACARSGKH